MGVSNDDEDGGGVNGDGSGGNSPSRQGAEIETSAPQNWSSMAVALRNFSWKDADSFRVFTSEAIYRRKGDVRGHPGAHTTWWRSQGWPAPPYGVASPWSSFVSVLDSVFVSGKKGGLAFVSSNFENISCITFLKYKNNRKQELALWHLVNRLVLENA
jgi:hypothetical protein